MKNILFLFILQLGFSVYNHAQVATDCPRIEFTYDAAGNRILRKWVDCIIIGGGGGGSRISNPDSTAQSGAVAVIDEPMPLTEGTAPSRDDATSVIATAGETLASISLYPNPTSGILYLNAAEVQGSLQVTVFDLQGRSLFFSVYTGGTQAIDLSAFSAGSYFVRLQSEVEVKVVKVVRN